jgi:hypothetical protein
MSILKKWWFWVGIFLIGLVMQKCGGGGSISYKEWFFNDSTNFVTWKNGNVGYARTYLSDLTLKKDSTFKLNFNVEGYGPVELSGKFTVAGMYNIADADYLLKKELELDKNEYLKLDIKWDNDVSSFDVLGNPYVGLPYRLELSIRAVKKVLERDLIILNGWLDNPISQTPLTTDGGITIDGINKRSSISVIPPFFYSYTLYVHYKITIKDTIKGKLLFIL